MEEIKAMLETLVQGCLKARNSEDEKEDKKEEKAENKKACNEDVDKRDIIRQIMAIAGKEEASEDVKTIAKLAEKLAYDKSEAGTADNCGKKAKNEEDEEDYEEFKEDVKEEASNKKCKNEDKEEKEAENKKAKNSIEEAKRIFFEGKYECSKPYMSQKEGIELGKELY